MTNGGLSITAVSIFVTVTHCFGGAVGKRYFTGVERRISTDGAVQLCQTGCVHIGFQRLAIDRPGIAVRLVILGGSLIAYGIWLITFVVVIATHITIRSIGQYY